MQSHELKQFAQELTALQRPLFVYLTKLLGRPVDAEDVLQEVNRILWEKYESFEAGTNLAAWATRIAQYEVLTFRKKQSRQRLCFSDEFLGLLADEAAVQLPRESEEAQALQSCLTKLPEPDRLLIQQRYLEDADLRQLAARFNRSEPSLCRSLARIRQTLFDCIRGSLHSEANS
ncbi:MAG TPA: sigma-70 family RNA polymerase sigma factor [Pirellulales bacterium]|jgi:RNA polymerase sigma-70 factor (ECF subfamily)|nr:sigma-70 family RNA polymerase sigma factor [Pirellulales bacterium]